jgi:hypothetical protein
VRPRAIRHTEDRAGTDAKRVDGVRVGDTTDCAEADDSSREEPVDVRSAPGVSLASSRAKAAAGDTAGAFADAVQAARSAPGDWASQAQVALTAEAVGAGKVGLKAAVEWARLAPGDWQAHAAVGRLNMTLGRGKVARAALHHARQLNPHDLDVDIKLTFLDVLLGGRHRRAALERVERLAADGHLGRPAVAAIVDAAVTMASRWLSFAAAYLTLGYVVLVALHHDGGLIRPDTWWRPALASAVVAAVLLWWLGPMLRRLTPTARRLMPGMLRREPLEAVGLLGHATALVLLLAVPAVWATGAANPALVVAGVAFGLSMLTEIITTGVGLGRDSGAGDFVRLFLQPPYIIGAVIFVVIVATVVRGVIRLLRAVVRVVR